VGSTPEADASSTAPGAARPVVVAPRRNRLTGRATALVVVLAMLAVAYTWPVKEYLRQRSELARLRADTAATQARVDVLEALKARWADPAYVQAQARERLHFVLPGETAYVVLQPDHPAAPPTLPKQTSQVLPAWYDQLWDSVRGADAQSPH
jgi:cell division protein FtsB